MNARPLLVYSREDLLRVKMGRAEGEGTAKDGQDKPVDNSRWYLKKNVSPAAFNEKQVTL